MCCVLGEGYNVCKTVLHTVNPIYMLGVLVAVFIILCFMWSSTFNIFLWQRFQPHILFCPSQKQQCSIMLNFSTRLKGHALFGREGVTVRKILGLAQTIAKLHKPLSTPSCCSAGVLLCWHSSCLPVLLLFLLEEIIAKTRLRPQMETCLYLLLKSSGKKEEVRKKCVNAFLKITFKTY